MKLQLVKGFFIGYCILGLLLSGGDKKWLAHRASLTYPTYTTSGGVSVLDNCAIQLSVISRASSSDRQEMITATAEGSISYTVNGQNYIKSTMRQQKSELGNVLVYSTSTFGLNFGAYSVSSSGQHTASGLNSVQSSSSVIVDCQYVADTGGDGGCLPEDDDDPICTYLPEICKHLEKRNMSDMIDFAYYNPDPCQLSPILLDLGRDGFRLGARGVGVYYDLLGVGEPFHLQWVAPYENDAFLVMDYNGNGLVDDGAELFGNGSRLVLDNFSFAPNGFVALAQYDDLLLGGDENGFITDNDDIWGMLLLWLDFNADGICTNDEMMTLADAGITRLSYIPRETRRHDPAGNWLRYWSWAYTLQSPPEHRTEMLDVFFRRLN